MWAYLLRRLIIGVAVLFVASFLMFVLVSLSGNPLANPNSRPSYSLTHLESIYNRRAVGGGPVLSTNPQAPIAFGQSCGNGWRGRTSSELVRAGGFR